MTTIIQTWSSHKTHIVDEIPKNNAPVKTRCGRTVRDYHLDHFGIEDCPRCGSPDDYEEIREELNRQSFLAEQAFKQRQIELQEKETINTRKRKEICKQIVELIASSELEGVIVGVEEWARCDNYFLQIDGLKFSIKAVL